MRYNYRYTVPAWFIALTEVTSEFGEFCGENVAEEIAEQLWNNNDQDPSDWPLTIELFAEDGTTAIGVYDVALDFDPVFTAEVKR